MRLRALVLAALALSASASYAIADGSPGPGPLTTLACRDREDPTIGATLVFDLGRSRLVQSSGSGPTILFDDHNVPVHVDAATIEWEVAHNTYTLSRATLELDVIGRVFICQVAKNQI
jgi:hypothetical protein